MATIALKGALLIDGTGKDVIEDSIVVIKDDTIVFAGSKKDGKISRGTKVIDVSGMFMLPGLIDTHVHLGGVQSSSDVDWILEPVYQKAVVSVAQAKNCLEHGFTSVGDISRFGIHLRNMINAKVLKGPRVVTCGLGLSRTGGHGDTHSLPFDYVQKSHPWALCCDGSENLRHAVRSIIRTGPDMIKIWATGGGIWELERKTDQHYSFNEIKTVIEEANYIGLPVRAHCESLEGAKACVKAGVYSIEHGQELDEECLDIMKEKNITLVPTMQFFYEWFTEYEPPYRPILDKFPGKTIAEKELNRTIANFQAAKEKGIRIVVGSDSFCSNLTPYGKYSLQEIKALVKAGLSEMEAIVAATKSGAEFLGISNITGTIEENKKADLLVLTENPLDDIKNLDRGNMALIMKDGEIISADKNLF